MALQIFRTFYKFAVWLAKRVTARKNSNKRACQLAFGKSFVINILNIVNYFYISFAVLVPD